MRDQIIARLNSLSSMDWEKNLKGAVVAGGFVRDTIGGYNFKDIDLFIHSDRAQTLRSGLSWEKDPDNKRAWRTRHKGVELQLIPVMRDLLEFVQERFDFVCCCGAVELGSTRQWFHPKFKEDVRQKRLTINSTTNIGHKTLMRVLKLRERGWHITNDALATVVAGVVMNTPISQKLLIPELDLAKELTVLFDGVKTVAQEPEPAPVAVDEPAPTPLNTVLGTMLRNQVPTPANWQAPVRQGETLLDEPPATTAPLPDLGPTPAYLQVDRGVIQARIQEQLLQEAAEAQLPPPRHRWHIRENPDGTRTIVTT